MGGGSRQYVHFWPTLATGHHKIFFSFDPPNFTFGFDYKFKQIYPLSFFLFPMSSHPLNFTLGINLWIFWKIGKWHISDPNVKLGRREDKKEEKERGKKLLNFVARPKHEVGRTILPSSGLPIFPTSSSLLHYVRRPCFVHVQVFQCTVMNWNVINYCYELKYTNGMCRLL